MIVEHEDRDRVYSPFRTGPLRRPAARLILITDIACIVGSGAVLRIPALAVAGTSGMYEYKQHDHVHEFSLISFPEPTGIPTLSLVALTVCLGLLWRARRLRPRLLLKLHKIVGFCVLGSGAIHATIVLLNR